MDIDYIFLILCTVGLLNISVTMRPSTVTWHKWFVQVQGYVPGDFVHFASNSHPYSCEGITVIMCV